MSLHSTKKARTQYSKENLERAVEQCDSGRMHLREAAETYNVPRSTISDHMALKRAGLPINRMGRPNALSSALENLIIHIMKSMIELGFPLGRNHVGIIIKSVLDRQGIKHVIFKDNMPGRHWLENFAKRYCIPFRPQKEIISSAGCATFTKSVSSFCFVTLAKSAATLSKLNEILYTYSIHLHNPVGPSFVACCFILHHASK